jgi:putative SOS response-associated peptidase YedK
MRLNFVAASRHDAATMCNHYQNHPEALPTWRQYIGIDPHVYDPPFSETRIDVWRRRMGEVVRTVDGARVAGEMAWGVPLTLPGKRPGTTVTKYVTNVRNLASPFWANMLKRPAQRCLVPFSRFAEPKLGPDGKGTKDEHWFRVADREVAAFAGLWRPTAVGDAYAFLTCAPNPLVAPLHPKAMPVILAEDDYATWLDGDAEAAAALAVPFPSQLMVVE